MSRPVAKPLSRQDPILDLRVVQVMARRELLRLVRERSLLFGGLSRTILWMIILGFGLGASLREIEGYSYAQYILPGVMVLNVLFASLQSAITLVWEREVGVVREVLVSPAPMLSVALGKLLGGAAAAVVQGSIPLLFTVFIGVALTFRTVVLAWVVMFSLGMVVMGIGLIIASRMRTFHGFGSISNGVIQPLYFLSGAIFPLKGIIGGVGFLDIPDTLRAELSRLGIHAIGSGWLVQLPGWLEVLVYANPVSYELDLLRHVVLGFRQLPLVGDLAVAVALPILATVAATVAMSGMRRG